jgi:cytoskeleton protein RodZ
MLRRAREARGLTEQQAAEQLNLDASAVSALERDDLAVLGAPVFAKGHLRRYGAMLGLVEDEVLAAYERARAQPEVPTLVPRSRQEMMPVRGRPKWPWVVGGALLFVLAAGLAAYVSEFGLRLPSLAGESIEPGAVAEPVTTAAPESAAVSPAAVPEVSVPAVPESSAATATIAPEQAALPVPQGHVSISLAFAADSWAEIYDGAGKAVLYDLGRAGTQRSIAAAAPLSLTVGNAPGVTLAVNGRPVAIPALPGGGTVARLTIEADGTVR